jgi:uncharacterized protein
MSERSDYPAGVPCWVDTLVANPQHAMQFYEQLFGWEFVGPPGPDGNYFIARLRGRDVAAVGGSVGEAPVAWNTYVAVRSVHDAVAMAITAGGQVLASPTDASPAGRFAVLADPAGAAVCVWEASQRQGAQLVNEPSAWAMSMLHSTQPDAVKPFYGELFGWTPEPFEMGGAEGILWRLPGYVGGEPQQPVPRDVVAVMVPATGASRWSVDFWIADADAAAENAARLGGSVIAPPHDTPGFRSAVLADPEGSAFSVSKLVLG